MTILLAEIGWVSIALLLLAAFLTSMIHGATGIAGGFLLTAVAAPIIGLQAVVPVLSVTLLISHGARALVNFSSIDQSAYFRIALPSIPFIIAAALLYGQLTSSSIAFILGAIVLLSVPARRWARANKIITSNRHMAIAGSVYGFVSGLSIGPGMLLMPVLLGYGLGRQAFVATLAMIALTTNVVRISVYGLSDLLTAPYTLLAVAAGLATVPGAWIGKRVLQQLTDERHTRAVEYLILFSGVVFFYIGIRELLHI